MIPTTEAFAQHVASHAAATEEQAIRATRIVLAMLVTYANAEQRRFLAAELPASLATALNEPAAPDHLAESGHALELVASICRVLVEELSTEAVDLLHAIAPPELRHLLNPPGPEVTAGSRSGGYESLATGKPGSKHPIADSGTTQERAHTTLAEGQRR